MKGCVGEIEKGITGSLLANIIVSKNDTILNHSYHYHSKLMCCWLSVVVLVVGCCHDGWVDRVVFPFPVNRYR